MFSYVFLTTSFFFYIIICSFAHFVCIQMFC